MRDKVETRQGKSVVEELAELRNIAEHEHGPRARSTRAIEEALEREKLRKRDDKPTPNGRGRL